MRRWLIGAMIVVMAVSLAACTPTTERQKEQATQTTKGTRETVPQSTGGVSDEVPDPNVVPVAVVSICRGGDSDSPVQNIGFLDTEGLDAQFLVDKLIEYDVLTQDTKALSFDIQGKGGDSVGALDLNQVESIEGVSDEMFLTEIGNTFTENFELGKLKFKVSGRNYQSSSIKQGDNDSLSYRMNYDSVEQVKVVCEITSWQRVP